MKWDGVLLVLLATGFSVGVIATSLWFTIATGDLQSTCDDYRTRAIDQCRADHGTDVGAYLDCVGELPRCE